MHYFYHGVGRFSLGSLSPNETACLLADVVVLLGAIFLACAQWRRRRPLIVIALFAIVWMFLATYSRGGWLALGVAVVAMFILVRPGWRVVLTAAALLVAAAGLTRHSVDRVLSAADVHVDASISHRLTVWHGMLELIDDNWRSGVGYRNIGTQYMAWYKPEELEESYRTAVSTPLTIAGAWGVPVAILCFAATVMGILAAARLVRDQASSGALAAMGILLNHLIAGTFSTFVECTVIVGVHLLALGWVAARMAKSRDLARWVLRAIAFTGAACLLLLLGSHVAARNLRANRIVVGRSSGPNASIEIFVAASPTARRGLIVFFSDSGGEFVGDMRRVIRPLCDAGFVAIVLTGKAAPAQICDAAVLGLQPGADPRCDLPLCAVIAVGDGTLAASQFVPHAEHASPRPVMIYSMRKAEIGLLAPSGYAGPTVELLVEHSPSPPSGPVKLLAGERTGRLHSTIDVLNGSVVLGVLEQLGF